MGLYELTMVICSIVQQECTEPHVMPTTYETFKQKSLKFFSQNPSNNNHSLNISNLQFKKKNFYSGSAARAKQIEIVGQLEFSFTNMASTKSGKLDISGWIPVNENNPQAEMMAQRKMIEELELLLLEGLLKEYWLIES